MKNHSSHIKLVLASVAGLVVLAAFEAPVLSYLPLLAILVICPLMIVFMMLGMGHGEADRADDGADRPAGGHRH